MAESMVGIKRSHRCTEVTTANIGQDVTVMGSEEQKQGRDHFCGSAGPFRHFADYI